MFSRSSHGAGRQGRWSGGLCDQHPDRLDGETGIFHNSVLSLGATVNFYHKRRLLIFGEYLPLRWLFQFFRHWVTIPMADLHSRPPRSTLLRAGGQPVGVSICLKLCLAKTFVLICRKRPG